jgi:hypothetical protein
MSAKLVKSKKLESSYLETRQELSSLYEHFFLSNQVSHAEGQARANTE